MSNEKENIFFSQLIMKGGRLIHVDKARQAQYEIFRNNVQEGQYVDVFFDANVDTGSLAQLAKVHACIREIAKETGSSFEDMKLEIKMKAGLCIKKLIHGEPFIICKSFSKCSKEELGLALQAIIEVGETLNINFH